MFRLVNAVTHIADQNSHKANARDWPPHLSHPVLSLMNSLPA